MIKYQRKSNKRGGIRPGAGRPRGARNLAARHLKEILAETDSLAIGRLKTFMRSKDPDVALAAIHLPWSYRFGRPPANLELHRGDIEIDNGYVVVIEAYGTEEQYIQAIRMARIHDL